MAKYTVGIESMFFAQTLGEFLLGFELTTFWSWSYIVRETFGLVESSLKLDIYGRFGIGEMAKSGGSVQHSQWP